MEHIVLLNSPLDLTSVKQFVIHPVRLLGRMVSRRLCLSWCVESVPLVINFFLHELSNKIYKCNCMHCYFSEAEIHMVEISIGAAVASLLGFAAAKDLWRRLMGRPGLS